MEEYSDEESNDLEFPKDMHSIDKEMFARCFEIEESEPQQFSLEKITSENFEDFDFIDHFIDMANDGTYAGTIAKLSDLIQYLEFYDDKINDRINDKDFVDACNKFTTLLHGDIMIVIKALMFIYSLCDYNDHDSLQAKMCHKIFEYSQTIETIHDIIEKEMQARSKINNPAERKRFADNPKETLINIAFSVLYMGFLRTPQINDIKIDLGNEMSLALKVIQMPFIQTDEKITAFRTIRALSTNFRSDSVIDMYMSFLSEVQRIVPQDKTWAIELLNYLYEVICRPEVISHILFECKFADGNPIINFINEFVATEDIELKFYANRVFFRILTISPGQFREIEYDMSNIFSLLNADADEITTYLLKELYRIVKNSTEATKYLCEMQLLEELNKIYEMRSTKGKKYIFLIFKEIVERRKKLASPEFIGEIVIPMCIERIQLATLKDLNPVFSTLQSIFNDDIKRSEPYGFALCFAESGGMDALTEVSDETYDIKLKTRVDAFYAKIEKMLPE